MEMGTPRLGEGLSEGCSGPLSRSLSLRREWGEACWETGDRPSFWACYQCAGDLGQVTPPVGFPVGAGPGALLARAHSRGVLPVSPGTAVLSSSLVCDEAAAKPSLALFSQTEGDTEAFGGGAAWPLPAHVTVGCHVTLLSLIFPPKMGKQNLPPCIPEWLGGARRSEPGRYGLQGRLCPHPPPCAYVRPHGKGCSSGEG